MATAVGGDDMDVDIIDHAAAAAAGAGSAGVPSASWLAATGSVAEKAPAGTEPCGLSAWLPGCMGSYCPTFNAGALRLVRACACNDACASIDAAACIACAGFFFQTAG